MRATKLRSPVRDIYLGHVSPRSRNLAYLSRSASTQPSSSSSSKYGFRGPEQSGIGGEEIKASKRNIMLTRGASFRRQGSSGMTWADNWIFTDDGMFSGRHAKVADDKGAASNGLRPVKAKESKPVNVSTKGPDQLERSRSVGSGSDRKHRSHHRGLWGLKWLKKNLRKAFR